MYSPASGRFISADTLIASFANPQSLNRYSYVYNRPINHIDPTGHKACDEQWGCNGEGRPSSTVPGKGNTSNNGSGNTPADQATSAGDTGGDDKGSSSPESVNSPFSGSDATGTANSQYSNDISYADWTTAGVYGIDPPWDTTVDCHDSGCWIRFGIGWTPLLIIGGFAILPEVSVGTVASTTTAAAAGEQLVEKAASSPTVQQIIQNINTEGAVITGNVVVNDGIFAGRDVIQTIYNITLSGPYTPEQWKDIMNLFGK